MKNKVIWLLVIILTLFGPFTAYAENDSSTNTGYRVKALQDKLAQISQVDIDKVLKSFTDMDKHWSRQYVGKLSILDIVEHKCGSAYNPDKPVPVDQFIKMIIRTMGFKIGQGNKYWAQPYIDTAIEQKILSVGEFKSYTKNITRQEAARIITKANLLMEAAPDGKIDALVRSKIKDYKKVTDADKQSVLIAYELGLMSVGKDGMFKPGSYLTRAEAATMMVRYLDKKERKPFKPAADEVCVITEPDGNTDTIYPPSKIEIVKAANAIQNNLNSSKGFVETVYNNDSDTLFFSLYQSKDVYDKTSIDTIQMAINITFMDDSDLLKSPYQITVYDPKSVKELHKDIVYSLFQYLYGKEADKAMSAFNRYLDYAMNGDSINRSEWVTFNNRKALYYKVKNEDTFSITINSLE